MRTFSIKPTGGGEFLNTSTTDFDSFPGFVAFTFPRSWFGERTQMAFSLLTRQQLNLRVDQRFAGNAPAAEGRYGLETLFDQRTSGARLLLRCYQHTPTHANLWVLG